MSDPSDETSSNVLVDTVLLDYIDIDQVLMAIPQVPRPISTTQLAKRATLCTQMTQAPGRSFCVICQYAIEKRCRRWSVLPCGHTFHSHCLYGLTPGPSTGASSAMSCPLCRFPIYRETVQWMGLPASIRALMGTMGRCEVVCCFLSGRIKTVEQLHSQICRLRHLESADGFIRSACLLHIERSIFHKHQLQLQLHQMAALRKGAAADELHELYRVSIACHVEVLIAVRNVL